MEANRRGWRYIKRVMQRHPLCTARVCSSQWLSTRMRIEMSVYVKMNKALYGLLRSALDFYLEIQGKLDGKDYVINPYDPCVVNKIINSSQHTVIWSVDDLKCSHKKSYVNTKFATWLGKIYGPKLTVKQGKTHDYLGMDLDWSVGGKVTILMIKYV